MNLHHLRLSLILLNFLRKWNILWHNNILLLLNLFYLGQKLLIFFLNAFELFIQLMNIVLKRSMGSFSLESMNLFSSLLELARMAMFERSIFFQTFNFFFLLLELWFDWFVILLLVLKSFFKLFDSFFLFIEFFWQVHYSCILVHILHMIVFSMV